MKTFLGIIVGLIIVFSNITALAASPSKSTDHVTVSVTIYNKSSVASLKYWDFGYARSFPSMVSYMPPLSPVNPNSSGSLSIKIPTKPTMIPATLSYGYDNYNNCVFLFSYQNNQLTVTPTPHGSVDCGTTPVVSGKSVTLMIDKPLPKPLPTVENYNVTVINTSSMLFDYREFQGPPGLSTHFDPQHSGIPHSSQSFSISLMPGDSYLTYAYYSDPNFRYDPVNACKVLFRLSSISQLFKVDKQGKNVQCGINVSGNNIVINITTQPGIVAVAQLPSKTYTFTIHNQATVFANEQYLMTNMSMSSILRGSSPPSSQKMATFPLTIHSFTHVDYAGRLVKPSLTLPDIQAEGSHDFSINNVHLGDTVTIAYGWWSNSHSHSHSCVFTIHFQASTLISITPSSISDTTIGCKSKMVVDPANPHPHIGLFVYVKNWVPSALCVRDLAQDDLEDAPTVILSQTLKTGGILVKNIVIDGGHIEKRSYALSAGNSVCFNYYKNIAITITGKYSDNNRQLVTTDCLDKNNVIQQGLISRVNVDPDSLHFCDFPAPPPFRLGKDPTVVSYWSDQVWCSGTCYECS